MSVTSTYSDNVEQKKLLAFFKEYVLLLRLYVFFFLITILLLTSVCKDSFNIDQNHISFPLICFGIIGFFLGLLIFKHKMIVRFVGCHSYHRFSYFCHGALSKKSAEFWVSKSKSIIRGKKARFIGLVTSILSAIAIIIGLSMIKM